ncbi:MAG: glycosyltransferase [Bacteroidota bacterium]|nr:glycosyltransferase [Bacteroidota bacterium]MDP4212832.1 glycosyltransferase [Bacteroidota bacterium]MDP4249000.1 glycosyltransferase [Bacteroidota bacterium]
MNIVSLVSYPFLPARTGGQKGIALFYKYFSRYHQVTCITTEKNDPRLAEGYRLLNILSSTSFRYINPLYFFRIRRILRETKASHLILEHPYYGWLGVLLKKSCGIKLVVHSHNLEGNRWKSLGKWWWPILWAYEKYTHRQADYNFFISDSDRQYAIWKFGLQSARCLTVSFGIEIPSPPSPVAVDTAQNVLHKQYGLSREIPLLFFNGAFKYRPNLDALENLLYRVNPILQHKAFPYFLLICGIDIPDKFFSETFPAVQVVGFAEDLELYLQGCNVFLNPVITGGGIKTKLVEALGYNLNAVSTESGSVGVDPLLCGGKLQVCKDEDWMAFADSIIQGTEKKRDVPARFYDHFYWGNITRRAGEFIEK